MVLSFFSRVFARSGGGTNGAGQVGTAPEFDEFFFKLATEAGVVRQIASEHGLAGQQVSDHLGRLAGAAR